MEELKEVKYNLEASMNLWIPSLHQEEQISVTKARSLKTSDDGLCSILSEEEVQGIWNFLQGHLRLCGMTVHGSVRQCLIVTPHVVAENAVTRNAGFLIVILEVDGICNLEDILMIGRLEMLTFCFKSLSSVVILEEREDSVHGQPVEMRSSLLYPAIKCCNLQAQGNIVDEMVIWKTNVPPKAACFGLFATHAYPVE